MILDMVVLNWLNIAMERMNIRTHPDSIIGLRGLENIGLNHRKVEV